MQKYRDKEWMNILQIALGLFFCKVAYNAFLIPNSIAAGGFTGIGQLINRATGTSLSPACARRASNGWMRW